LEYLSDGITESVINSLSKSQKVKVIALSSVLRYKGKQVDSQTISRELGVSAMVTGRVVQRPEGISVSVELVNVNDRSRIWGDQYNPKRGDILAIQEEISTKISDNLRLHLSPPERQQLGKRYTQNSEAYQDYLKGRYYAYKDDPEDYQKSLEHYRQAIERDPTYALAYAGMARSYVSLTWEGWLSPAEGWQKAQSAAAHALELDDEVALGHFALAQLHFGRDWDWKAADREHRRALELDPQDPLLHRFAGFFFRALGKWDDAIAQMKRAQELDPLTVETTNALGATYYWARSYDSAIGVYKKSIELDPKDAKTHEFLADVYARKNLFSEAIGELRRAFELNGDEDGGAALANDFQKMGYLPAMRSMYRKRLSLLEDASGQSYVSPINFVVIYAFLDDKDRAIEWLEKAYAEHSPWLALLRDPEFDNIRPDPRFADLFRRVGLPG
jgi:TolB-like protein